VQPSTGLKASEDELAGDGGNDRLDGEGESDKRFVSLMVEV